MIIITGIRVTAHHRRVDASLTAVSKVKDKTIGQIMTGIRVAAAQTAVMLLTAVIRVVKTTPPSR